MSYETIRHWCQTFGLDYARQLRRRRGRLGDTWYPRWTPQKRPLIDTAKAAISGMAAETGGVLPRGLCGTQVGLDLRAPAAWPALEDMAMMQQAIQQGGDGRGVAESFAPVVNGPV